MSSAAFSQEEAEPAPGPCHQYLRVFATYDELVNGKLVDKVSTAELTNWSRNSTFEGFVATKDTPANADLTVEFTKKKAKKATKSVHGGFKDWKLDANYRLADLDIHKVLDKRPTAEGTYTVHLHADGKNLCTETKPVVIDAE